MNCFHKSLYLKPGKILGVALAPFSAFQASVLSLMESPFIEGGYPEWGDIITALLVFQSNREDGLEKCLRFQNSKVYRAYWWCRLLLCNTDKVAYKINSHIEAYLEYPEVEQSLSKRGESAGAPWWYYMVSLMWQETGVSLDDLWDMPLCELSCHKAIHDELHGGSKIAVGLLEERERNRKRNAKD